jgi:hypothetical protein
MRHKLSEQKQRYEERLAKHPHLKDIESLLAHSKYLKRLQARDPDITSLTVKAGEKGYQEMQDLLNFRYHVLPPFPAMTPKDAYCRIQCGKAEKEGRPFNMILCVKAYAALPQSEKERLRELVQADRRRFIKEVQALIQ